MAYVANLPNKSLTTVVCLEMAVAELAITAVVNTSLPGVS